MMHRLHPRYTLRTLLVLVTLAAALFGWEEYVTWKEERAVRAIERMQGTVIFESVAPQWLQQFAGENYMRRAKTAIIHSVTVEDAIPYLHQLGNLQDVRVVLQGLSGDRKRFDQIKRLLKAVCVPTMQVARVHSSGLSLVPTMEGFRFPINPTTRTAKGNLRDALPSVSWPDSLRHELNVLGVGLRGSGASLVKVGAEQYMYLFHFDRRMDIVSQSSDEVRVALVDRGRLINAKAWQLDCDYDQISLLLEDLNDDGRRDVGVHYWRLSYDYPFHDEFMPQEPLPTQHLPNDERFWLDAFEITPTGFKSLFDENEVSGDE